MSAAGLFAFALLSAGVALPTNDKVVQDPHFPGVLPSRQNIVTRSAYTASFNRQTRQPNWVAEKLAVASFGAGEMPVLIDQALDQRFIVTVSDYASQNVYIPFQFAAAAFHCGDNAECADVHLAPTNVSPLLQLVAEAEVARLDALVKQVVAEPSTDSVYVLSGPLWIPATDKSAVKQTETSQMHVDVIGDVNLIPVPTHIFKIVKLVRKDGQSFSSAFVFENRALLGERPLSFFTERMDIVEQRTGLNLSALKTAHPLCNSTKSGVKCDEDYAGEEQKKLRFVKRVEAIANQQQMRAVVHELLLAGRMKNEEWKFPALLAKSIELMPVENPVTADIVEFICPGHILTFAQAREYLGALIEEIKSSNREL